MPRKIDLNIQVETPVKPKREITEAQREHLNKIRLLAMAKKAELKEITLKSKLAKTVPKQELAKEYDNYIAQKAVHNLAVTNKPKPAPQKPPLENLVYQSNKDQLYQRMVEERIRHAMVGYGNSLGV